MLVDQTFDFILDAKAERKQMEYPRMSLAKKASPGEKIVSDILSISKALMT
jgi:hypothetical protein